VLKVHETVTASGVLSVVLLRYEHCVLAIVGDDGTFALPDGALDAVMVRFGAPLDPTSRLTSIATLDLGSGRTLRHVRHLARYDVIARDYLVYEAAGREPLCALATSVAGALDHLGRAVARLEENTIGPESAGSQ
jgi:hypothetical protein